MWQETETSTQQDHIIHHVIGLTVLGWFVVGDAAHFLLDIGLLWTIYVNGEMNLMPQGLALAEFDTADIPQLDRQDLVFDADLLLREGRQATGLRFFENAPGDCQIENVEVLSLNSRRRIVIRGEASNIHVDTDTDSGEVRVSFQETR